MANTYAPFGLLPFGRREGGSPTAGLTRYFVLSSDPNPIFCGDTVKNSTTGNSSSNLNYITWDSSGQSNVVGVFMGCEYYNATVGRVVWSRYFPGTVATSTTNGDVTAYVIDDPEQLFIVQGSTTGVIGSSLMGLNFAVQPSSQGNTTDGHSVLALLSSVNGSTVTYPFRLVDTYANYAPPGAPNVDITSASAILVVAPNNWQRKNLTARAS